MMYFMHGIYNSLDYNIFINKKIYKRYKIFTPIIVVHRHNNTGVVLINRLPIK